MAQFFKAKKTRHSDVPLLPSLEIESYSDDGRGIARIPRSAKADMAGKTVFVEGALLGERVSAKVLKTRGRYIEAAVAQIDQASPQRQSPLCPHYSQCGACHTQHMSLSEQHLLKQQAVLDQLQKWAGIQPDTLSPVLSAEPYHYRRRIKLAVDSRQQQPIVGFRQHNSRKIVSIEQCPVMEPALANLLIPLNQWLSECRPKIGHIELLLAENALALVMRYLQPIAVKDRQQLQQRLLAAVNQSDPGCLVHCLFQGGKQDGEFAVLEDPDGNASAVGLSYTLETGEDSQAINLQFRPQDFIQANRAVNQSMVTQAINWLEPQPYEHMQDFFCGLGNFSLPLATRVASVTAYEGVEAMVDLARDNARQNGIDNIEFRQRNLFDCEQLQRDAMLSTECDGMILDPPRAGAKLLCESLFSINLRPKRIVYISCNSATFARDAQILCGHGYQLSRLGMVDMFPQTFHSEIMALFVLSSWQQ